MIVANPFVVRAYDYMPLALASGFVVAVVVAAVELSEMFSEKGLGQTSVVVVVAVVVSASASVDSSVAARFPYYGTVGSTLIILELD